MMNIISLGAGVQSSTMALMAERGELGYDVDCAIFADTGAEPKKIYEYLDWIESAVSFPVYRVMRKAGLLENIKSSIAGGRFAGPPLFTETDKGTEGRLRRYCTSEFKIQPIDRKVRELVGLAKGRRAPKGKILANQLIGISMDEAIRMKPNARPYIENQFPLIEKGMHRHDCLKWMADHGYPLPSKSSCTFCPYHDDGLWREMKNTDPDSWAQAVEIDEMVRGGVRGTRQKLYLHRSLTPLADVDFRNAEDRGQLVMFGEECEGMCGV